MNCWNTPKLAVVLVVIAASLFATSAPARDEAARQEIHELLNAFLAGASTNDIEMHDRFWAEDLVYTSSTGQRRNKAETMAGVRATSPADTGNLATYRGEDVNIRVFDDLAVVTFRLVARMPNDDMPSDDMPGDETSEYFNTGVFAHREGQWRAFTWQATRIPSAADN